MKKLSVRGERERAASGAVVFREGAVCGVVFQVGQGVVGIYYEDGETVTIHSATGRREL